MFQRILRRLSGERSAWLKLRADVERSLEGRGIPQMSALWIYHHRLLDGLGYVLFEHPNTHLPLLNISVKALKPEHVNRCLVAFALLFFKQVEAQFPKHADLFSTGNVSLFGELYREDFGKRSTLSLPKLYQETLMVIAQRCGLEAYDDLQPPFDMMGLIMFRGMCETLFPLQVQELLDGMGERH